jgi:hypothetical protein
MDRSRLDGRRVTPPALSRLALKRQVRQHATSRCCTVADAELPPCDIAKYIELLLCRRRIVFFAVVVMAIFSLDELRIAWF